MKVQIKIDKGSQEYAFSYRVNGKIILQCARCLNEFFYPFDEILEKVYTINPLYKYDDNYSFITHKELDITPDIKETILLSIPIKPLCDENCVGIKVVW